MHVDGYKQVDQSMLVGQTANSNAILPDCSSGRAVVRSCGIKVIQSSSEVRLFLVFTPTPINCCFLCINVNGGCKDIHESLYHLLPSCLLVAWSTLKQPGLPETILVSAGML